MLLFNSTASKITEDTVKRNAISSYYYLSSVFAVQPKTLRGQNANNKPKTPSNGKNLKPRERDKKQRTEIQSAPMNQN